MTLGLSELAFYIVSIEWVIEGDDESLFFYVLPFLNYCSLLLNDFLFLKELSSLLFYYYYYCYYYSEWCVSLDDLIFS